MTVASSSKGRLCRVGKIIVMDIIGLSLLNVFVKFRRLEQIDMVSSAIMNNVVINDSQGGCIIERIEKRWQ